jgi:hypothetical protein
MNRYMQEYIDSIESENSQKVIRHVFKRIGKIDIQNYNQIQLEHMILGANVNSSKDIITIIYILSSYAKWLQEKNIIDNDNLYQILQSIDKKSLWKKAKPQAKKKFISNEDFKRITHDISLYEEYNSLYYETLFRAVYEGIYNDDLSVLKNLRKSDIDDNIVTLREDNNHVYKIKVSDRLAKDLKQLADINIWERRNRFSVCKVEMRGIYSDSVFKVEHRSTSSNGSYRFTYYSKLRKIAKEYLEHSLLPLQLYTSGIMHRIKVELEKNNISLEEAFTDNSRNKMAHLIIQKELIRCNSSIEIGNFRELVKGHLDSF